MFSWSVILLDRKLRLNLLLRLIKNYPNLKQIFFQSFSQQMSHLWHKQSETTWFQQACDVKKNITEEQKTHGL